MWIADGWSQYSVLDASGGEKLENWGGYLLVRPDPQVIWDSDRTAPGWRKPNAHYHRSSRGGGSWEFFSLPESWDIHYTLDSDSGLSADMVFHLKPFSFKHTGVFPEQAVNWEFSFRLIRERMQKISGTACPEDVSSGSADSNPGLNSSGKRAYSASGRTSDHAGSGAPGGSSSGQRRVKVLNLFAYTGGATMAAALAGAEVVHVDASKGMVSWARENAASSGLSDAPIRWIVDDCRKFVEREIRRGRRYDAIIMDPPSYGRGPGGEVWKMEESIFPFLKLTGRLLSDDPLFVILNSYTTGLQPGVLKYMMSLAFADRFLGAGSMPREASHAAKARAGGAKYSEGPGTGSGARRFAGTGTSAAVRSTLPVIEASEIGLPVRASGLILPEGATGRIYAG